VELCVYSAPNPLKGANQVPFRGFRGYAEKTLRVTEEEKG